MCLFIHWMIESRIYWSKHPFQLQQKHIFTKYSSQKVPLIQIHPWLIFGVSQSTVPSIIFLVHWHVYHISNMGRIRQHIHISQVLTRHPFNMRRSIWPNENVNFVALWKGRCAETCMHSWTYIYVWEIEFKWIPHPNTNCGFYTYYIVPNEKFICMCGTYKVIATACCYGTSHIWSLKSIVYLRVCGGTDEIPFKLLFIDWSVSLNGKCCFLLSDNLEQLKVIGFPCNKPQPVFWIREEIFTLLRIFYSFREIYKVMRNNCKTSHF